MKTRLFVLACAACLTVPAPAKAENALATHMEALNDAYKAFRRESDPVQGAAMAREAQQAVLKAIAETPELVAAMTNTIAKAKASAEYRSMLGRVFVSLCEVEQAFLAGKTEEVPKIVAALKDMKKSGHGTFMEDE